MYGLDKYMVGPVVEPLDSDAQDDGAGWLASHAQDAVNDAFAAGLRVPTAKDRRCAAEAVKQYERAHKSCGLIGSLASLSSYVPDAAPADVERQSADAHTAPAGAA